LELLEEQELVTIVLSLFIFHSEGIYRQELSTSGSFSVSYEFIGYSLHNLIGNFRMVELHSGEIFIDDYNIRNIGLRSLRSSLALVPQDTTLFLGTLRDNL